MDLKIISSNLVAKTSRATMEHNNNLFENNNPESFSSFGVIDLIYSLQF
ncbi:hypothetical protein ES703_122938 [subsurface metagenome]